MYLNHKVKLSNLRLRKESLLMFLITKRRMIKEKLI